MTRRRLSLMASLLVGLVIGLAVSGGGTFAAFSNATANPANTFAASSNFASQGVTPVRDLGTAECGNATNSLSVPAGGVPIGNTLVARLAHRSTANTNVTIRDDQQNTWTKDADVFQGNVRIVVFSAYITKALSQNDQITVTFPATGEGVSLNVEEFSGIAATNRVDVVGTGVGTNAQPSATVTTTNGNDLLFGAVAGSSNRTFTEPSGWATGGHHAVDCGGASRRLDNHSATRSVTTTGTFTYNPTTNFNSAWAAAVVAYRAAAGTPSCGVPSTVHITGFEYGTTVFPSTGLVDAAVTTGGAPLVQGTTKRNGNYSLGIDKNSAGGSYVEKSLPSSATSVARLAFRFNSLPSANVSSLIRIDSAAGSEFELEYLAAQNRLAVAFGTQAEVAATSTVQAGRWYVLEFRVNFGTNPRTAQWRIDGVDQPQASLAETGSTVSAIRYGSEVAGDVFHAYIDDVLVSNASADYPLGDGKVLALRPNVEGAGSTRTNFGNETGTTIGTNANLRLDEIPMDSAADYIWQDTVSTTSWIEVGFEDITQTCVRGVAATLAYSSSGTGGNLGKTSLFLGATERVLLNGDMSAGGTGIRYARDIVQPTGSYWTQATLNGMVARMGYSNDITPAPRWHGITLEYGTLP